MKLRTIVLGPAAILGFATAQTVNILANDPRLKYTGDWISPSICQYNAEGDLSSDQPGCYNLGPSPCADEFKFATSAGASVSLTFKGTAIAISSLTQPGGTLPTLVTVTLDGDDDTFQSVPISRPLSCPADPFQKDELELAEEHTLKLVLRVPPASDLPVKQTLFFGIKQFVITGGDIVGGEPSSNSTTTPSGPTTTTGAPSPTNSSSTPVTGPPNTTDSSPTPSASAPPPNTGDVLMPRNLAFLILLAGVTLAYLV